MFLGSFGLCLVLVGEGENAQTKGWSVMTFSAQDSAETLFHCWAAPSQTAQEGLFQGPVLKARNDAVKSEVVQMCAVGTVTLQMQTDDHR